MAVLADSATRLEAGEGVAVAFYCSYTPRHDCVKQCATLTPLVWMPL